MKSFSVICLIFLPGILCTGEETTSQTESLKLGKPFELYCTLASDPTLNITWSKDDIDIVQEKGRYIINHENNSLIVENAKDSDAGEYKCSIQGSANQFHTIKVTNVPRVDIGIKGKSKTAVQGDELKLPCSYWGTPKPTVVWYKDEVELKDANDTRIKLTTEAENGEGKSILTIEDVQEEDQGDYICKATSEEGVAEAKIMVRVKDKLAALWPFLGIVCEVAVLCTIIFIYERRRSKQEQEDSDTDQSPEAKNNGDNTVRQRK